MDIGTGVGIQIDADGKLRAGLREAFELAGLDESPGFEFAGRVEPVGPYLDTEEAVIGSENNRAAKDILILGVEKEDTVGDFYRLCRFATIQPEQAANFAERSLENPYISLEVETISRRQMFRLHLPHLPMSSGCFFGCIHQWIY